MANKNKTSRRPLDITKYKYTTEWLQDVKKEKRGIPTRGRMPKLERSLKLPKRKRQENKNIPVIKPKSGTSKTRVSKTKVPPENIRNLEIFKMLENLERKKPNANKYGGGKVKYRSIGGKVTNGNDITRMVYD
jgi:hypothetical protein